MSKSVQQPCFNLRSKEMLYGEKTDEAIAHDKEVERLFGACDTAAYWCQCTQTGRGPDDQPVNRPACSLLGRKCYEGIGDLT